MPGGQTGICLLWRTQGEGGTKDKGLVSDSGCKRETARQGAGCLVPYETHWTCVALEGVKSFGWEQTRVTTPSHPGDIFRAELRHPSEDIKAHAEGVQVSI